MVSGMAIDVGLLEATIRASWSAETSDDPDEWSPANPSRGQCAVTAKVVQDYLGGTLLIAPVLKNGEPVEAHCWNVLPDGEHLDLTTDQFGGAFDLGEPVDREPVVDHTGVNRHLLLADTVRRNLSHNAAS